LTQKEIKYDWTPYKPQESQYDIMKREFEANHFLIDATFVEVMKDNTLKYFKYNDMKTKLADKQVMKFDEEKQKTISTPFLELWLKDITRRHYDKIDFIPNVQGCPETTFNLFHGFNAEKYQPSEPLSKIEIAEWSNP
jgi:hypothetical protein